MSNLNEYQFQNINDINRDNNKISYSIRHTLIVEEFENTLEQICKETDIAINSLGLDNSIYGFHKMLNIMNRILYDSKIFVFKNISILVSGIKDINEDMCPYLFTCVYNKNVCSIYYFYSFEIQERIINNLRYLRDYEKLFTLIDKLEVKYNNQILKKYIYHLLKQQLYSFILSYKNGRYYQKNLLFNNNVCVVGLPYDLYKLRDHFKKELELIESCKTEEVFQNFVLFLQKLIKYKIILLSDNELCLMLKIYCVDKNINMKDINQISSKDIFESLCEIFNNNKNLFFSNDNTRLCNLKNIFNNKLKKEKFIFLNETIKNTIDNLNDIELSYLKKVLQLENESQNTNEKIYKSISTFGAFICSMINKEIYEYIIRDA